MICNICKSELIKSTGTRLTNDRDTVTSNLQHNLYAAMSNTTKKEPERVLSSNTNKKLHESVWSDPKLWVRENIISRELAGNKKKKRHDSSSDSDESDNDDIISSSSD